MVLKHFVSSANNNSMEDRIYSGRSLMLTKNSKGPRILPCGTPNETGRNQNIYCRFLHIAYNLEYKI